MFKFNPKKSLFISPRALTLMALLTALSIILTRYASVMVLVGQSIRVGLGSIPIMIAGLILGPVAGALTGLVADLLGVMINLMGAYMHPGFTLTSMLTGFLPGIVMYLQRKYSGKNEIRISTVLISWALVTLICSVLLQTLWLSGMQSLPYMTVLLTRMTLLPFVQTAHVILLLALRPIIARLYLNINNKKLISRQ